MYLHLEHKGFVPPYSKKVKRARYILMYFLRKVFASEFVLSFDCMIIALINLSLGILFSFVFLLVLIKIFRFFASNTSFRSHIARSKLIIGTKCY